MLRIRLDFHARRQEFRFLDSVNAAIVAALVDAGAPSQALVGHDARPWTFGVKGYSRAGGCTVMTALTVSTPDEMIARALEHFRACAATARPVNGDLLDFSDARVSLEHRLPHEDVSELAVAFASPFAIIKPKTLRSRTVFYDDLADVDLSAALRAGLEHRAARALDIELHADPLTLAVDARRRLVSTRLVHGRRILIPAFSVPLTLRGSPHDVRFAYFAGVGAKTRGGFGCPVIRR